MSIRNPFSHPDHWEPDMVDIPTCSSCGVALVSGTLCRDCDTCPDCGARDCANRIEGMCLTLDE